MKSSCSWAIRRCKEINVSFLPYESQVNFSLYISITPEIILHFIFLSVDISTIKSWNVAVFYFKHIFQTLWQTVHKAYHHFGLFTIYLQDENKLLLLSEVYFHCLHCMTEFSWHGKLLSFNAANEFWLILSNAKLHYSLFCNTVLLTCNWIGLVKTPESTTHRDTGIQQEQTIQRI